MKRLLIAALLSALPITVLAGRYTIGWLDVSGKGVVGCDHTHAKDKARGLCSTRLRSGERIERVELKHFNAQNGVTGSVFDRKRYCTYTAEARCIVSTPGSKYGKGSLDPRGETLIYNDCGQPALFAVGHISQGRTRTPHGPGESGFSVVQSLHRSEGPYKIKPGTSLVVKGDYLLLQYNGKIQTRADAYFCYDAQRFRKLEIGSGNPSSIQRECAQKGSKIAGFENSMNYSKTFVRCQ